MAYCPECGSEVAENDVFCPYCGGSLQSADVENNNVADGESEPFESTIFMPLPNKKINNQSSDRATFEDNQAALTDSNIKDKQLDSDRTGDYSQVSTLENFAQTAGSVPIDSKNQVSAESPSDPEKQNLAEENEKTIEDEISPEVELRLKDENESQNQPVETPQVTEESAEPRPEENNSAVKAESAENESEKSAEKLNSETESSLMSYDESEVKENLTIEEVENSSANNATMANEPDFTATIPYMTAKPKAIAADESKSGSEKSNTIDDNQPSVENGKDSVSETSIAKPSDQLPENSCPPPMFDSVRIMQPEESQPKTVNSSASNASALKLAENQPPKEQPANQSESKNKHSNTSPNIGIGDTDGKNRGKLKPLDEGTVLNGRYEIVRKIGGGGMGAVYIASDKNLGGVLRAVKEMVQSFIEEEQQDKAVNDFKRESLLLTSLEHQSIPTIYDYFFDEKEARFYLVMKYITGGDLSSRLRSANEGRIDEKNVTEWAIQIADVLDYLHNRQPPIVYRDLKPANIMIDGNSGRAMLIDFGIARWINKEEKGVTAVGTMGYAPPELFSGNVEPRSDIYSLGSTMFHLLTGADPQSNPLLIFDFQKNPRPRQINPQLSDQMEKFLMRSVEYNTEMRFSSAAEMRQTLVDHLENLQTQKVTFGVNESSAPVGLSDQLVFCGFCGQKIVATDMFCAFCGAKQPLARQGNNGGNFAPQPVTAQLLIVGTNELETPAYRIEKDDNLIGRRDPMSNIFPEVDLSRYDPQTKISRRHARIIRDGNKFIIEDLGSSNGTTVLPVVNETVRLLPHNPYTLTNGDKLRLGDTTLHFVIN